jgi:hypothetical protein
MENALEIIDNFLFSPWLGLVFLVVFISLFIIYGLRATAKFKKTPHCISEDLRSQCLQDLDAAKAAQKAYFLIVEPNDSSPIRLEHADGTILGRFHSTYAWGRDEQGRPIPSYKSNKWYMLFTTWDSLIYESQNTALIPDFYFTFNKSFVPTPIKKIYDWHSCEQIGSITFDKEGWSSYVSGPELSAEIKFYPKLNDYYYGEVCVLSDDNRCLGFLQEETTKCEKKMLVIKSFKHSLLLADDLTPEQTAVVLTALLTLIHRHKTDQSSGGD